MWEQPTGGHLPHHPLCVGPSNPCPSFHALLCAAFSLPNMEEQVSKYLLFILYIALIAFVCGILEVGAPMWAGEDPVQPASLPGPEKTLWGSIDPASSLTYISWNSSSSLGLVSARDFPPTPPPPHPPTPHALTLPSGSRQANRVRALYLNSMLRQDMAYFDTQASAGKLLLGLNEDTAAFQAAISEHLSSFVHNMAVFAVGMGVGT
jgi:hypothetical protein